jgi:hypothetical protein
MSSSGEKPPNCAVHRYRPGVASSAQIRCFFLYAKQIYYFFVNKYLMPAPMMLRSSNKPSGEMC